MPCASQARRPRTTRWWRPPPARAPPAWGVRGGCGCRYSPSAVLRAGLAAAWRLRAVPTEDALLQLLLNLPTLHATKARQELGWIPRHSGVDAIREVLHGVSATIEPGQLVALVGPSGGGRSMGMLLREPSGGGHRR